MIQAPNELREVAVGATVNLFVSVGQTSRRLKGTVQTTRERGADEEVLEVHVAERTPSGAEIVFWLGFTDEETFLLPLDDEGGALVYVKYKHSGGHTGLYVDGVREVGVRTPDANDGARGCDAESHEAGDRDGGSHGTGSHGAGTADVGASTDGPTSGDLSASRDPQVDEPVPSGDRDPLE